MNAFVKNALVTVAAAAEPLLDERIREICVANKMGERDLWLHCVAILRFALSRNAFVQEDAQPVAWKRIALDLEVKETEAAALYGYLQKKFTE